MSHMMSMKRAQGKRLLGSMRSPTLFHQGPSCSRLTRSTQTFAALRRKKPRKECTEKNDAHVHALAVLENDWLIRQWPHRNPHEFICEEGQAFAKFCGAVLVSVSKLLEFY